LLLQSGHVAGKMLKRLLIYYAMSSFGPERSSAIFGLLSCNNCSSTDAMLVVFVVEEFRKFGLIFSAILAYET